MEKDNKDKDREKEKDKFNKKKRAREGCVFRCKKSRSFSFSCSSLQRG